MPVYLDHFMVPSRNKLASAKLLAEILGVPWAEKEWNEPDGYQWELLTVSYARSAG